MSEYKSINWLHAHGAWVAILTLAVGAFAYGYCWATIQARADRTAEIAVTSAAYQSALDAKDKLINQLAGTAIIATDQAVDAATAASKAANVAAKAASTAAAATAVKVKQ